ncbi:hypothetical protein [Sorangium cellulosum]|uniref:hypothetical protein n=1 Tax=Sorangium cellulosum TaxID=56 RepID=UPI001012B2EF|nr:hypothetical protein [Sorangium cellulosum]
MVDQVLTGGYTEAVLQPVERMKIVAEKPWEYRIESRGDEVKAIILSGSSAIYTTEVLLTAEEARLLRQDKNNADRIIESIKKDTSRSSAR